MFPFAMLLSACDNGGGSGTVTQDRTITHVNCAIRSGSVNYTYVNDFEIRIAHDVDIYNLISNQDFVVTVYYSDGTNEVVNSGYTFNIIDHTGEGMYYDYTIEVSYSGIDYTIYSINVITDAEMLPMFTNLSAIGDIYSGYNFTEELRYNNSEYDVSEMIVTGDGTTLAELVAQNKVILDTSNYGYALPTCTYQATNPNEYYNNGEYGTYSFIIRASRGYQWEIEGQAVDSLTVNWQIKRQIIDTPVLTSATEFTYQHRAEVVNGETTYVGVPQSLTFNYGNGAQYVTPVDQQTNCGLYQTTLRVKDDYDEFYIFMINGEERDAVWFDWSITPMQLTVPTIEQDHYTYTGSEIKPAVISDCLDLFDITYPTWCVTASDNYWYQIDISLKSEYYYSYNYNFGYDEGNPVYSVNLNYYIDLAPFPTAIATDLTNINFVLERDLNYDYDTYAASMTYEEYVNTLYKGDFVNSVAEMVKFQEQYDNERYSRFEFELPDTMPNGLTANSKLNANITTGYPVKVTYWYDQTNYQPYTFTAIMKIKPREMPINTRWERWISTTGYSGYINAADSEIVYDPDATYGYRLNNIYEVTVNYTIYYGTAEGNINTQVNSMSNAGYYQIVATLVAPNNNNTNNFLIYDENDNSKTPIASLTYPNIIHINQQPISFWAYSGTANYVNTCENYYVEGVARNIDKPTLHDTMVLPYVDDQDDHVERVKYYRANQNMDWVVAENTIDVGYYKTVFTWHLNDNYNDGNYQLVSWDADTNTNVAGGFATVEWYIYPNTYALQTTNPNADGYIGWLNNTEFSVYYNNNYDWPAELPVTKPDGIGIYYMYDSNPRYDGENSVWIGSGSQNSSGPSGVGDYLVYAIFYVKNIAGWDHVTVTIDGEQCTVSENNKDIYSANPKHLEIVEQAPSNIVLNNNVAFDVSGYKYFSFTTGAATEYMIITDESNAVFNFRLASGMDYIYLNGARLNNSQSYYLLHELEPNANYVLRIGPNSYLTEGTRNFLLMVYPEQLDFEYLNTITVYDFIDGTINCAGFVVSAHDINVGETVTVPATVYAGVPNDPNEPTYLMYSAHDVIAIAANGFENNTMTCIDLPFIKNIGDHAFKNCTNLRDIYFAYYSGDWENIVFGEDVFEGCTNLILHTGNGGTYHVAEDGSITEINA